MKQQTVTAENKRSSVSTKIILIVAIFSLPIGVLAYLLAANYTPQIDVANLELAGNTLQRSLMKAMSGALGAKTTLQTCATEACASDLGKQLNAVISSLDEAAAFNAQHARDLSTTVEALSRKNYQRLSFDSFKSDLNGLIGRSTTVSSAAERTELASGLDGFVGRIKQLISHVGNTSNLILDPDLDSYYTVDVTLLATPEMFPHLAKAAAIGNTLITGPATDVDKAALAIEVTTIQEGIDRITESNKTAIDADAANHGTSPTLEPKLRAALQTYQTAINAYVSTLKTIVANPSQIAAPALSEQATAVQKSSLDYWNTTATELDTLLNMRIADFQGSRLQALGYSAFAVLIAAFVAFALSRSITKPLQELVRNLGPGATLLGVSVERIAEASQSRTPNPEESAIICEELNAHADNMRKAVLELARHVQGSGAAAIVNDTNANAHS